MIHQPLGGAQGQATDIKIHVDHIVRTHDKLNRMLAEVTGQPLEIIHRDTERDNFMSAQEAWSTDWWTSNHPEERQPVVVN